MAVTYTMRKEIVSLGHTKDYNALTKYPFVHVPAHISFTLLLCSNVIKF